MPPLFPRHGPNCWNYVKEVIDGGLTGNTVKEFEEAFACELGVRHVIATPTCTPAMAELGQLANSPRTGKRSRRCPGPSGGPMPTP